MKPSEKAYEAAEIDSGYDRKIRIAIERAYSIDFPKDRRYYNQMAALIALLPVLIQYTPVLIAAIQHIKGQTGQTTDEIFTTAGMILDANDQKLIDDLKRLGVI